MVSRDRDEHQNDMEFFVRDKAIAIHCRRNFLYEDAFDKLSPENGTDAFVLPSNTPKRGFKYYHFFRAKSSVENEDLVGQYSGFGRGWCRRRGPL